MYKSKTLRELNEYFLQAKDRTVNSVYFYRINQYNEEIRAFILQYYEKARACGVVIEGKIANPDEKQLSYYTEMMGTDFQMELPYIAESLARWLPRMNESQRSIVANAIYNSLLELQQTGKNINMLKNAYIKFMCWLYYKFERVIHQLGKDEIPKVLYEGTISAYELKMLDILSHSGCDIVLLQYEGDQEYVKLEQQSVTSMEWTEGSQYAFPEGFSIASLRKEKEEAEKRSKCSGTSVEKRNATNVWLTGEVFQDILMPPSVRGENKEFCYNALIRMSGVEDKLTYMNELFGFQQKIKSTGRNLLIEEHGIERPTVNEIAAVKRDMYGDAEQLIYGIVSNIKYASNQELEQQMKAAFISLMMEERKRPEMNVNRLTNKAVYLICWLKRYQSQLFQNQKMGDIACFIYLGGCKDDNESLFLRYLAKLPVDVLILVPDLHMECVLSDSVLFEKRYTESLEVRQIPREEAAVQIGTAAYHAERELDTLMYRDSGLYRDRQHSKAVALPLQTMYEEIAILWDQELKYRPNFSVSNETVNMPVLFAKVSGVKDGDVSAYWSTIKSLMTENTIVVKEVPFIDPLDYNPIKGAATTFYKNGQLRRTAIKEHPSYQYGFLRKETQEYILDKLQLLLNQKRIKGMGVNGTEYTVIATVLHLNRELLQLIQQFDFTKKNPKLLYINTSEKIISLEDSILCSFLSLIGFDIVFFVPNGYQTIEKHYNEKVMEEHQIGDYVYEMAIPDFNRVSSNTHQSWCDKIFRRGNRNGFRF